MSVFDGIYNVINAVPAVHGKVYHAEALKGAAAPFVFWLQTGERFEQALDGYTELGTDTYEVHIVTKNLTTLALIAKEVRNAIIAMQGTTAGGVQYERVDISQFSPVINEHEVNLYRKVYSITVNYQEVLTNE